MHKNAEKCVWEKTTPLSGKNNTPSASRGAFYGCSSLTSITLPAVLTSLGEYAFYGCSSMTSIALPAGLTSLGERAFWECSSLTSIELPAGLTSVGKDAFNRCSSLTSIALPAGFDDRILRSASVPPGAILRVASAVDNH